MLLTRRCIGEHAATRAWPSATDVTGLAYCSDMELLVHRDGHSGEPVGVWPLSPQVGEPSYIDQQSRVTGLVQVEAAGGVDRAAEMLVTSQPEVWKVADVEDTSSTDAALGVLRGRWAGTRANPDSSAFAAAVRRQRFAVTVAPRLAALLLGDDGVQHDPGVRVPAATRLYRSADGERLAVLVPPGEAPRTVDAALAYGLTYQGDRDLLLALPTHAGGDPVPEAAMPSVIRAAWVVTPVQVFIYDPDPPLSLTLVPRLARSETLPRTRVDDALPMDPHPLGERESWVAPIVEQVGQLADVVAAHRQSYRTWHVLGRQVLQIRRTRSGLRVTAGVNHSAPSPDRPPPIQLDLDAAVTSEQLDEVMAAVQVARQARLAGQDRKNREAWLQARLASKDGALALGLVGRVLREIPASRPPGNRAYIDLLGVDRHGAIHLVETKLGDDVMLALQGLDYWVWLQEHLSQIVTELRRCGHDVRDDPPVLLDYVVGDPQDLRRPKLRYLPPQLEALDGKVGWRLGTVSGWTKPDGPLTVEWQPRRSIPDFVERLQPPRYTHRVRTHLADRVAAAGLLTRRAFLTDPGWTVRPAAAAALAQLRVDGLAHHMVDHICSSQRFAIELFAGLDAAQRLTLARQLDDQVANVDRVEFEYTDPHDRLREATRESPHATQVDALLRTSRHDGSRHLLLIEVKLTEDDFGGCSAFQSDHNTEREVCRTPAPFGGDVERCFQLRNHDREHRRRYDRYLPAGPSLPSAAMCPFAFSGNQPMRNLALAAALIADGEADSATFALCAHDDHQAIWRRWRHVQTLLPPLDAVQLASLPASQVLASHHPDEADALATHYALPQPGFHSGAPR